VEPNVPKIDIYENLMASENFSNHTFSYLNTQCQNKHIHTQMHTHASQMLSLHIQACKIKIYDHNAWQLSGSGTQTHTHTHIWITFPKSESSENPHATVTLRINLASQHQTNQTVSLFSKTYRKLQLK